MRFTNNNGKLKVRLQYCLLKGHLNPACLLKANTRQGVNRRKVETISEEFPYVFAKVQYWSLLN